MLYEQGNQTKGVFNSGITDLRNFFKVTIELFSGLESGQIGL